MTLKAQCIYNNNIKNGETSIEKIKEDKKKKINLNEITIWNSRYRLKYQPDTIKNIKNLYNSREKVIKIYNDYAKIISEAMYKKNMEKGLKYYLLNKCFKDYQ